MWLKLNCVDKVKKIGCGIEKTNFRLIVHRHSSTDLASLAKIGPVVDFVIIGPTGIVEKNK